MTEVRGGVAGVDPLGDRSVRVAEKLGDFAHWYAAFGQMNRRCVTEDMCAHIGDPCAVTNSPETFADRSYRAAGPFDHEVTQCAFACFSQSVM